MSRRRRLADAGRLCSREVRRRALARIVDQVDLKGTYERAARQEWAESRKGHGWDARLVDQAVSAGALKALRSTMLETPRRLSLSVHRAIHALAIIDTGLSLETQAPHFREE